MDSGTGPSGGERGAQAAAHTPRNAGRVWPGAQRPVKPESCPTRHELEARRARPPGSGRYGPDGSATITFRRPKTDADTTARPGLRSTPHGTPGGRTKPETSPARRRRRPTRGAPRSRLHAALRGGRAPAAPTAHPGIRTTPHETPGRPGTRIGIGLPVRIVAAGAGAASFRATTPLVELRRSSRPTGRPGLPGAADTPSPRPSHQPDYGGRYLSGRREPDYRSLGTASIRSAKPTAAPHIGLLPGINWPVLISAISKTGRGRIETQRLPTRVP